MSDWDETQTASSDSKQRKFQKDSKKWNVGETITLRELLKERKGKASLEFWKSNFGKTSRGGWSQNKWTTSTAWPGNW